VDEDKHPARGRDLEELLPSEAKESLRHLELFARRTVEGLLKGIHRSRRIGVSTEFDHHTEYQPGDPLRHIDWKASARQDRYFVKRYEEETALSVRILVDRSASMLRESDGRSKYIQACRLAACLAYLIIKERDAAGLALTNSSDTLWLPPSSRNDHLVAILSELATMPAGAEDSIGPCLRSLVERDETKGLVVLISDLMFDPDEPRRLLASLQAQGHEVLLCQVRDPGEEDFPFNRWVQFRDLENPANQHRVDTVPLKKIYRQEYQHVIKEWREWAKKCGMHFVTFRTDAHVATVLSEYLAYRSRLAQ
jgi:uncharacterized protein (DUF58 family)